MALTAKHLTIAGVVAFYFFVSISLVFTNKVLLSDDSLSVPAPMFVTWFQCVVTVAVCWALGKAGKGAAQGSFLSQFPEFVLDWGVAYKVLPLSCIFVGMVMFNNLTLKFVEVSFYNVARSLTIVFNVVFTYLLLGSTTSLATLGTLAVVILGFLVGTKGEVNFSLVGTLFGVAASAFVSLNSIYTRKTLPAVGEDKWLLTAYNNVNAVLIFIPLILLSGEATLLTEYTTTLQNPVFWGAMLVSGAFGTLIGIATVLQIQTTSPLTHNISGTAKAAVQSILAVQIWQNEMTAAAWIGLAMVLGGSLAYAYVRKLEMDAADAQGPPAKGAPAAAAPAPAAASSAAPSSDVGDEFGTGVTEDEEAPLLKARGDGAV